MSKNSIQGVGDAQPAAPAGLKGSLVQLPDLQSFMQRVIEQASAKVAKPAVAVPAAAVPIAPVPVAAETPAQALLRRDYDMALNLLQRASQALPILTRQCDRLEEEVRQVRARSQAELEAANGMVDQWRQLAVALKEKLEVSDRDRDSLRERLDQAEKEVTEVRRQIDDAEHQASIAVGISTLFHDKIVEAFGVGSKAHATLDMIVKGEVEPRVPPAP